MSCCKKEGDDNESGCCGTGNVDPGGFHPKVTEGRKCTDCLCLILFWVFWIGMIVIAVIAGQNGNPEMLVFGSDYQGSVCGGQNTTACGGSGCANFRQTVYPRVTQDLYDAYKAGITNPLSISLFGVCTSACPAANDWVCDYQGLAELKSLSLLSTAEENSHVVVGAANAPVVAGQETAGQRLGYCQSLTSNLGGSLGPALGLSPWQFIPAGGKRCRSLLKYCYPIPARTQSYFYRCIPLVQKNSNTTEMCLNPPNLPATSRGCLQKQVRTVSTTQTSAQPDPLQQQLGGAAAVLNQYMADIQNAYPVIFSLGLGGALVLGLLWILLLRFCAGVMVWVTVFLLLLLLALLTLMLYIKGGILTTASFASLGASSNSAVINGTIAKATAALPSWVTTTSSGTTTSFQVVAYIMTVITVIYLLLIIALQRRVRISIGVIKEASKAIGAIPALVVFPLFQFLCIVALTIYFVVVLAYLHTSSNITTSTIKGLVTSNNIYQAITNSSAGQAILNTGTSAAAAAAAAAASAGNSTVVVIPGVNSTELAALGAVASPSAISALQWLELYHFFGFLWTNQFISGISIMTIAGAVCSWYWVADKSDTPKFAVLGAFKRTILFHLGSVAFGSLIIAIIQFIRAIMAYIDRKSKNLQKSNKLIEIALKCCQCCLWCFEKCMKFINRNAYIMVAMCGYSFCKATRKAVMTILSNVAQVGTMNFVATIMLFLGKVVISLGVAFFAWLAFQNVPAYQAGGAQQLTSSWLPMLLTAILGYFVAGAFLNVYSMTIDTIVLCFCLDRENNDGSPEKPYYMGDSLRKFVGKNRKAAAATDGENGGDNEEEDEEPVVEAEGKQGDSAPIVEGKAVE